MTAKLNRRVILSLAGGAAFFPLAARAASETHQRLGVAFGTQVRLALVGPPAAQAEEALDGCFRIIRSVEAAASLFRPDSEIIRLNSEGRLKNPSDDLRRLLVLSREMSVLTEGAWDPTVQPLWRACDNAVKAGDWPSDARIGALRENIDWRSIEITQDEISFARRDMALTLNGIAQGYAAERVAEFLRARGVTDAFLDTGEIESMGRRADGADWRAGLADPRKPGAFIGVVSPFKGCLSTSGDYACAWSPDFVRHHILDPATGVSPPELASTCVIAPRGGVADALSTAVMIMGAEKGLALVARLPGVEALFISKQGAIAKTAGFPFTAV